MILEIKKAGRYDERIKIPTRCEKFGCPQKSRGDLFRHNHLTNSENKKEQIRREISSKSARNTDGFGSSPIRTVFFVDDIFCFALRKRDEKIPETVVVSGISHVTSFLVT